MQDTDPFPIQADGPGRPECSVPLWLAKLAHREYARHHDQSFDRIAERGGFGRGELVACIRGDYSHGGVIRAISDLGEAT